VDAGERRANAQRAFVCEEGAISIGFRNVAAPNAAGNSAPTPLTGRRFPLDRQEEQHVS
jgi:hypothetical protein